MDTNHDSLGKYVSHSHLIDADAHFSSPDQIVERLARERAKKPRKHRAFPKTAAVVRVVCFVLGLPLGYLFFKLPRQIGRWGCKGILFFKNLAFPLTFYTNVKEITSGCFREIGRLSVLLVRSLKKVEMRELPSFSSYFQAAGSLMMRLWQKGVSGFLAFARRLWALASFSEFSLPRFPSFQKERRALRLLVSSYGEWLAERVDSFLHLFSFVKGWKTISFSPVIYKGKNLWKRMPPLGERLLLAYDVFLEKKVSFGEWVLKKRAQMRPPLSRFREQLQEGGVVLGKRILLFFSIVFFIGQVVFAPFFYLLLFFLRPLYFLLLFLERQFRKVKKVAPSLPFRVNLPKMVLFQKMVPVFSLIRSYVPLAWLKRIFLEARKWLHRVHTKGGEFFHDWSHEGELAVKASFMDIRRILGV